jgi:hypothetical protein
MKNIYFYIYPEKKFASEYVAMSKAQIDNSLLYFQPQEIIVVTNFPFEYHGVKSLVFDDELNAKVQSHGTSLSNKPIVIKYLIEHGLVDDLNWFHDWDIWQLAPLSLPPITKDVAFVDYSYKPRIQFGSIFFKPLAWDIFGWISEKIEMQKQNEEETTNILVKENFNNIQNRIQKLNVTYNIGMLNLRTTIKAADKPLRIAHFPPYKDKYLKKAKIVVPPQLFQMISDKFLKNLLIYISPDKKFNPEHELMIQVQIDNSLKFWRKEDIILFTNFPFEYNGIKAIVGPDNLINKSYLTNKRGVINSKVNAIIYLLENKIINGLTWFHDFDSFQLSDLDLPVINGDIGVVCYGIYPQNRLTPLGKDYKYRVNFGNFFFKPESLDIFKLLLDKMEKDNLYEEDAMTILFAENYHDISNRVQIMNQTYNIGMRYVRSNIQIAEKPIKIAHFPPHNPKVLKKFSSILPPDLYKMLYEKFTYIS